ncbi:MAG: hypothetical protein J7485_00695 [Sphingobium sp.]|nr:hypothetical protein [Sphingobium sp.]
MAIGAELAQALRNFAKQERDIVQLGQRVEPDNALEFVRMRRSLVMCFAEVGTAMEKDSWLNTQPPEVILEGRQLFSAFRAANSINQANWPAIMARDDPQGYQIAARPVGDKSRAFWAWVEKNLGFKK